MKVECCNFRARLADALRGPLGAAREPVLGGPSGLGWHAHVIDCAACRELLSEEEALDELLRSLPLPHLPRALAERVLSRLDAARRGVDLDRLLDLPLAEPVPVDLARSVIARVHAEAQLDRLLERIPAPKAPAGMDRRVLARLELARRGQKTLAPTQRAAATVSRSRASTAGTPSKRLLLRIAASFALVSLAAWGAWSLRRALQEEPLIPEPEFVRDTPAVIEAPDRKPVITVPAVEPPLMAQPNDELLAALDIFEAWDLLATADGVDASLSTLDSLDEYLLDFESAPASADAAPAAGADSKPAQKNG